VFDDFRVGAGHIHRAQRRQTPETRLRNVHQPVASIYPPPAFFQLPRLAPWSAFQATKETLEACQFALADLNAHGKEHCLKSFPATCSALFLRQKENPVSCKVQAALNNAWSLATEQFSAATKGLIGDHIGTLSEGEYVALRGVPVWMWWAKAPDSRLPESLHASGPLYLPQDNSFAKVRWQLLQSVPHLFAIARYQQSLLRIG